MTDRPQRPAWQVVLGTTVSLTVIVAGLWAGVDALVVSEAEAGPGGRNYVTAARATHASLMVEKIVAAEAAARIAADASLAKTMETVVQTVERIDRNQILIGERLRVQKLDKKGKK